MTVPSAETESRIHVVMVTSASTSGKMTQAAAHVPAFFKTLRLHASVDVEQLDG